MILLMSKSVSYKKWSNNRRKDKNRQIKKKSKHPLLKNPKEIQEFMLLT